MFAHKGKLLYIANASVLKNIFNCCYSDTYVDFCVLKLKKAEEFGERISQKQS
jgi:hypothetical protein